MSKWVSSGHVSSKRLGDAAFAAQSPSPRMTIGRHPPPVRPGSETLLARQEIVRVEHEGADAVGTERSVPTSVERLWVVGACLLATCSPTILERTAPPASPGAVRKLI